LDVKERYRKNCQCGGRHDQSPASCTSTEAPQSASCAGTAKVVEQDHRMLNLPRLMSQ
jgi:hypothetical protein